MQFAKLYRLLNYVRQTSIPSSAFDELGRLQLRDDWLSTVHVQSKLCQTGFSIAKTTGTIFFV